MIHYKVALAAVVLAGLFARPALAATTLSFQDGVGGYTGSVGLEIAAGSPYNDTVNGYSDGNHSVWVDYPNGTGQQAGSDVLLKFPNIFGTGANQIPLGSTITSATLQVVTTTNYAGSGNGGTLHRMLVNWSGTDTWNSLGGVDGDNVKATSTYTGQYSTAAVIVIDGTQTTAVTADLQAWSNGAVNNGWAILPWTGGQDGWGIWDPTYSDAASRPLLSVTFTPAAVPEPASLGVLAGGLVLVLGRPARR